MWTASDFNFGEFARAKSPAKPDGPHDPKEAHRSGKSGFRAGTFPEIQALVARNEAGFVSAQLRRPSSSA